MAYHMHSLETSKTKDTKQKIMMSIIHYWYEVLSCVYTEYMDPHPHWIALLLLVIFAKFQALYSDSGGRLSIHLYP